ncbi:MAG: translation initiation factor IF-2 N-terminal domain-containing protein, partial [Firmicutes bacterium]|nr:translation initiation factor IF-2 N-terminal domain-containing protein [Bacillota bacterium]
MKIKDLAAELNLTGKEVLEKAKSMGIEVSKISDELSDINATAVKNTILRSGAHTETKVVRATAKKTESTAKTGEPKVTTKAANIKLPEVKKTTKAAAKTTERTAAAKPPVGKPVVSKEVEGRPKPPVGKPVVSKAMLEERLAREAAEKEAAKAAKEEAKEAAKAAPAEEPKAEPKAAPAPKAEEAPKAASKEEVKEAPKADPIEEKKAEEPKQEEAPKRLSRLKVVKKAEDVRREEAEAAERRAEAAKKRAEEKKSAEKREERPKRSSDRPERRQGDRPERGERRGQSDRRQGERRQGDRPERPDRKNDKNARNERPSRPAPRREEAPAEVMNSKPGAGRGDKKSRDKDKDKEHDKFSKLERGGKKGKMAPKSLEKQVRNKKSNKPKVVEPEVEEVILPVGTVMINVPITVAGFAEQTKTTVSQIIMTLMKMGVMANVNQNLDEDTVVLLAEELGIQVVIG